MMLKKRKLLKENTPTNSMGMSSSTPGSGPIDTFDPILGRRNRVLRRFMSVWKGTRENTHDRKQE